MIEVECPVTETKCKELKFLAYIMSIFILVGMFVAGFLWDKTNDNAHAIVIQKDKIVVVQAQIAQTLAGIERTLAVMEMQITHMKEDMATNGK